MVATIGFGLAAAGAGWKTTRLRDKEAELLFVGTQFQKAIALYYYRSPTGRYEYPPSLDELIEDPRHAGIQRYLREIYRDPITGRREWDVIRSPEGGIMGVHSVSTAKPLKTANFPATLPFDGKQKYSEWEFVFVPTTQHIVR